MRWDYLKMRGIGPFRGEVEIDLTKLGDARLVAVVGPNGAGKSTLLEVGLPGAMDRATPTRGSLLDLATGRDSFVETRITNGSHWTLRHLLDGVSKKSEALVLKDGEPVLPGTSVRGFDKWRAEHLASSEVLFASTFSAQDSKGFLEASRTERVGVILRLVQADHLEGLAARARECASGSRTAFSIAVSRLADERARAGDDLVLEAELGDAKVALAAAEKELADITLLGKAADEEWHRIERLKAEVEDATKRRAELQTALDQAVAHQDALELRAAPHRALIAEADAIRHAAERVTELRAQRLEAERQHTAQQQEAERNRERRTELALAHERAVTRVNDLRDRIANNRAVLAQGIEIRAAAARLEEVRAELVKLVTEEQLKAAEERQHSAAAATTRQTIQSASSRVDVASKRLSGAAALQMAADGLPAARATVERLTVDLADAEADLKALRGRHGTGAEERVTALRGGLTSVVETCNETVAAFEDAMNEMAETAVKTLEADTESERDAKSLPAELAAAERLVETVRGQVAAASQALAKAEASAARLPEIAAARTELAAAEADREVAAKQAAESDRLAAEANLALAPLEQRRLELDAEAAQVALLASKLDPLTRAEARLAEHEPDLERATSELVDAKTALDAAPPAVEVAPYRVDEALLDELTRLEPIAAQSRALDAATGALAALEPELAQADEIVGTARVALEGAPLVPEVPVWRGAPDPLPAQTALDLARADVAKLTLRLEQAKAGAARIAELEAERARLELDLSDWNQLAADLGKDGIQAMEVDAAGPELTDLTNTLLHECLGPRFTVRIDTQRASSDGKRMLEGCDVNVLDSVEGRDAEGSTFSGGERVILGEALSLALAMFGCQRSGETESCLIRDESGAALDPANAGVYVAMLRRAAELTNSKIFVVSHTPTVWDLCDARITVRERGIELSA